VNAGSLINRGLDRFGLRIVRGGRTDHRYEDLCRRIHDLLAAELVTVPPTPGRVELLADLRGTDVLEAMYLLHHLHAALPAGGDVCEFGVAQGSTSALIANELQHHATDRHLWLYDSFEGLPAPTAGDELIDDVFNLGSLDAYAGEMAVPQHEVVQRLASLGWESFTIVPGYVTSRTTHLPQQTCFAYADFDFYEPTLDVLRLLRHRMSSGGRVMVDDYGWFSSGVEKAVMEFLEESPQQLEKAPSGAGPFVTLLF
jgi:O-methyltransferase